MQTFAWCSMLRDKNDIYRVRFNRITSGLLKGVSHVSIVKTERHLVLIPTDVELGNNIVRVHHEIDHGFDIANVSMNRIVKHEGIISGAFFGKRTRYKVKKDKDGRIYVCLTEVVK